MIRIKQLAQIVLMRGLVTPNTPQGFAMVGNYALVDDFALRVKCANGVLLVAEVDSDSDGRDDVFHGNYE